MIFIGCLEWVTERCRSAELIFQFTFILEVFEEVATLIYVSLLLCLRSSTFLGHSLIVSGPGKCQLWGKPHSEQLQPWLKQFCRWSWRCAWGGWLKSASVASFGSSSVLISVSGWARCGIHFLANDAGPVRCREALQYFWRAWTLPIFLLHVWDIVDEPALLWGLKWSWPARL